MKKCFVCLMSVAMVLGTAVLSSAAIVTDPTGDNLYPQTTDLRAARAEQQIRGDGVAVLKVSYTASPNIGGIMIFEADVDSSTGTGGNLSMTGIPVTPCPCKTTPGIDVVIMMLNRDQGATSNVNLCGKKRYFGEWLAVAAGTGTSDTTGFLRGFSDPTPLISRTSESYTFPWANILVWAKEGLPAAEKYSYTKAIDPALTKWQLSVWTDPTYGQYGDQDDFGQGLTFFWISDWMPNGNGNLVPNVDAADRLTFCEGNFDGDFDQDGSDIATFKTDIGRSGAKNPCPYSNYYY